MFNMAPRIRGDLCIESLNFCHWGLWIFACRTFEPLHRNDLPTNHGSKWVWIMKKRWQNFVTRLVLIAEITFENILTYSYILVIVILFIHCQMIFFKLCYVPTDNCIKLKKSIFCVNVKMCDNIYCSVQINY